MKRFLAVLILLCPFASGCAAIQPTSGSQAVDWTPDGGFTPTSDPGYVDGHPLDMRKGQ